MTQPRDYDTVLGGKDKKAEHLRIEFLSGHSKNLIFNLWVEIKEFKTPDLIEFPFRTVMIGMNSVGSVRIQSPPQLFSLKFEFANLGRDISQLSQVLFDGPNRIRISANTKQIDSVFLCINWEIDYDVSRQRGDNLNHGLVSMSLKEEAAWDTTARN